MRVIVAGSRTITEYPVVKAAIEASGFEITELVSGGARGVDRLGEQWARVCRVPIQHFFAAWDEFGKSAGYQRNREMAEYADGLIAVWDGVSRGTKHMIDLMVQRNKRVYCEMKGRAG